MNLPALAVFGEIPVEIYDEIKEQVELALTYLEDGASHTAADVLRQFLGRTFYQNNRLINDHEFQYHGRVYERDPRTGFCYRLDNPLHRDSKSAWRRIARNEYAREKAHCLNSIKNKTTGGKK
jgi:hypothetical protein